MADSPVQTERIEEEVKSAIATTLRIDPSTVDLDSSIVQSLGATSIDFLDINFRLESAFGIKLATQLVLDHVEEELGEGVAIDRDSKITEPAARLLQMHLGDVPGLEAGMYADEVAALVTPRVLVSSVRAIVDHLADRCPACGASDWKADDGMKVACAACGAEAEYPDGDELTREWIRKTQAEHGLFPVAG